MKQLKRSSSNIMLAGVCGGFADYLGADPTLIRILFVLLSFLGGSALFFYLIMWIITPME